MARSLFSVVLVLAASMVPQCSAELPKVLHFVWVSDRLQGTSVPGEVQQTNINKWQELNPDWTVMLWDNDKFRAEGKPEMVQLLEQHSVSSAGMADLIRFWVLANHGGLYLDTDIAALQPLDERLMSTLEGKVFAGCDGDAQGVDGQWPVVQGCDHATNAYIGVPTGQMGDFSHVIESMWAEVQALYADGQERGSTATISITGPQPFTKKLDEFLADKYIIIDRSIFAAVCDMGNSHSCDPNQKLAQYSANPNIYGMHMYLASWKNGELGNPKTFLDKVEHAAKKRASHKGAGADDNGKKLVAVLAAITGISCVAYFTARQRRQEGPLLDGPARGGYGARQ